jgi:hypothetical protein
MNQEELTYISLEQITFLLQINYIRHLESWVLSTMGSKHGKLNHKCSLQHKWKVAIK